MKEQTLPLYWRSDRLPIEQAAAASVIARGSGRSFGDSARNSDGVVLSTTRLDRFISFDRDTGLLRCEAGVLLGELLEQTLPYGWSLPVLGPSRFITVGGAIATDSFGENQARAGSFGRHVNRFELARSDGSKIMCSADENPALFRATIGGLGLTGVILWAELRLKNVPGPWLETERLRCTHVRDFFRLAEDSQGTHEYAFAWVDALATGPKLGRGFFLRANDAASTTVAPKSEATGFGWKVPFELPSFVMSRPVIRSLGELRYQRQSAQPTRRTLHYSRVLQARDSIEGLERLYGRRGLLRYECVVPIENPETVVGLLEFIPRSGALVSRAILRRFGEQPAAGLLSLARKGYALSLEIANDGAKAAVLTDRLDDLVKACGGAVGLASDTRMSGATFRQLYPNWEQFATLVDPRFSSNFWRRVSS